MNDDHATQSIISSFTAILRDCRLEGKALASVAIDGLEEPSGSSTTIGRTIFYSPDHIQMEERAGDGVLVRRPPGLYSRGSRVRLPGTSPFNPHLVLEGII